MFSLRQNTARRLELRLQGGLPPQGQRDSTARDSQVFWVRRASLALTTAVVDGSLGGWDRAHPAKPGGQAVPRLVVQPLVLEDSVNLLRSLSSCYLRRTKQQPQVGKALSRICELLQPPCRGFPRSRRDYRWAPSGYWLAATGPGPLLGRTS